MILKYPLKTEHFGNVHNVVFKKKKKLEYKPTLLLKYRKKTGRK